MHLPRLLWDMGGWGLDGVGVGIVCAGSVMIEMGVLGGGIYNILTIQHNTCII